MDISAAAFRSSRQALSYLPVRQSPLLRADQFECLRDPGVDRAHNCPAQAEVQWDMASDAAEGGTSVEGDWPVWLGGSLVGSARSGLTMNCETTQKNVK